MRGFPILRSALILIWLGVAAFVLAKVTHPSPTPATAAAPPPVPGNPHPVTTGDIPIVPFTLSTSAEMAELVINGADQHTAGSPTGTRLSAPLHTEGNPQLITLAIRWKNPPAAGERRFAKLTVNPPGKPSVTHVFDSSGDIDDILELP